MKTISISTYLFRRVFRCTLLSLLISAGCIATAAADKAEDDGVVIGSIVVHVAEPRQGSSFGRGGRKLENIEWALVFSRSKSVTNRYIKVKAGAEKHFLEKLRSGSYRITQLAAQGFANFYLPLDIHFDVAPKVTTYLGRLEVTVPYRFAEGPVAVRVVDGQEQTVEALRGGHAEYLTDVRKVLIVLPEGKPRR